MQSLSVLGQRQWLREEGGQALLAYSLTSPKERCLGLEMAGNTSIKSSLRGGRPSISGGQVGLRQVRQTQNNTRPSASADANVVGLRSMAPKRGASVVAPNAPQVQHQPAGT